MCSALKLNERDRFLDMSCGWGSVLIYAVSEHGVRGQGMAFSEQQAATITERLRQRDLHRKCTVECRTSVEPAAMERTFQKIIDISLFDQTAHFSFRSFLEEASRILSSRGMLLMHRATRCPRMLGKRAEGPHLESPGSGPLPLLSRELQVAESSGYQILNVEDLSEDYRLTLHHWIERLGCYTAPQTGIANWQFRSWLFRLLDIAAKVDVGEVQLEQILLRRTSIS
jgi:cyclopropane-fatty-acyl-phospholipid synthase